MAVRERNKLPPREAHELDDVPWLPRDDVRRSAVPGDSCASMSIQRWRLDSSCETRAARTAGNSSPSTW